MSHRPIPLSASADDVLAKFTEAAYQVVLRRGLSSPFIDVELELWRALSATLAELLRAEEVRIRPEATLEMPRVSRPELADLRDRVDHLTGRIGCRQNFVA